MLGKLHQAIKSTYSIYKHMYNVYALINMNGMAAPLRDAAPLATDICTCSLPEWHVAPTQRTCSLPATYIWYVSHTYIRDHTCMYIIRTCSPLHEADLRSLSKIHVCFAS